MGTSQMNFGVRPKHVCTTFCVSALMVWLPLASPFGQTHKGSARSPESQGDIWGVEGTRRDAVPRVLCVGGRVVSAFIFPPGMDISRCSQPGVPGGHPEESVKIIKANERIRHLARVRHPSGA